MVRPSLPLFLSAALTLTPLSLYAAPKLQIDTLKHAFGTVSQGDTVSHQFTLTNSGDTPLELRQAQFSMPGMALKAKQQIAPGESATINLSWDTQGFSRENSAQALLLVNDPERPKLLLTLEGFIQAPLEIMPMPAYYLSQFQGESRSGRLQIMNHQEAALKIDRIEKRGEHFTASLEEVTAGKAFGLEVTVAETTPPGRYRESLILHTNHPERPKIGIEVNILVKPDLYAQPESAEFGTVDVGQLERSPGLKELVKQTLIVHRRAGDMTVTALHSDLPFITLESDSGTRAGSVRVVAGIDTASAPAGPFSGQITLETDDPRHPQLTIPVSGFVSR